jgi:tetratricopeptide (TPR) repeat protein
MRSSSTYAVFSALALASLLWFAGASCQAQQSIDDDRARAHFFAGESHFAAERWADAEREFALAYELSARPEMLINLSRAQERNGQLAEAIGSLELLIAKHSENSYRGEAEARIASMRKQLAERPPEPAPVVAAVPVTEPELEPATPAPLPAVTAEPEPDTFTASDRGIWPPSLLTLGVGGAAVVTAVVALGTGLRAHKLYNDLDSRCDRGRCESPFEDTRDRGQALSRTSTALTFVSVALAGGAAVLWVYDVKKKRDQHPVALGIDGAGARLRAQF